MRRDSNKMQMKDKVIIGLNLKYYMAAMVLAIVSGVSTLLPYASAEGKVILLLPLLLKLGGTSYVAVSFYAAAILAIATAVFSIVQYQKTSKRGVFAWQVISALNCVAWTSLLFVSKMVLEGAGIYGKFLNKNLSAGFWLGFVSAYLGLIFIMRVTGTNIGYILLTIMSIIWLFPILWIVLTAFREEQGYYVGYFIPHGFTFNNFVELFSHPEVLPFGKWWVNTLIVSAFGCVINTMIILMCAFILSRTRYPGRKTFMNVLMIIGMFPGFMSLIAVYNILKGLGLNQSLTALIIVGAAGAAMGYHVTKGFFDTIPKALDEAATIDGASRFQIFTKVTLPLSSSIIVYIVLGAFMGAWSDYIFPSMLFGDKQASYTVAVGLYWMTDFRRIDSYYTQFAAGALVVAIPIVILFVWLQRFYVEGLSGAVKG